MGHCDNYTSEKTGHHKAPAEPCNIPMRSMMSLSYSDINALTNSELVVYLNAALGVIRINECELQRANVARHFAEYNYHSAMLDKHKKLLADAQEANRTGVNP